MSPDEVFAAHNWLSRAKAPPWGLTVISVFLYLPNIFFVLIMLAVTLIYRPKTELFRWSSPRVGFGLLRSIGLGLAGGVAAFALASPVFWFGDRQLFFIRVLIANALSPLGVLHLVLFILALSVTGEIVYRRVVFRTLADYTSVPAAVLGSCLLFAYISPVFSFPFAIILGAVSAILYYKTRNLLAPIIANVVLTLGGGALTLYQVLMRR
jgi:membrane protease YdiL (CAAX protease family)